MVAADIRAARWPDDTTVVRALMRDYVESLGVDLSFQDVEAELAGLPGRYALPGGEVLLAWVDDAAIGVVARRALSPGVSEMKRLYVQPDWRNGGIAKRLAIAIIDSARAAGATRMVLDTLSTMTAAQALYTRLGFRPVAAYYDNPLPGTVYMARDL